MTGQWVEVEFDCMPLRSVSRLDVPVDASPAYEQFVLRVKDAMSTHGTHNTYYLHRGSCTYHLTNDPQRGQIVFAFEGTVMTGEKDLQTKAVDVKIRLKAETCAWLSEPMVEFLTESVKHALLVEFDRYIEAGDLQKTEDRIKAIQAESDSADGFMGMYL
ncbi:hypothetical protein K227x_13820 [Rubripirellula lacrimiformis]|uniref:Uncharacterized protein n=1 Tax=Rubripirellula lacrimiformis TaxID=1930273 RepID=A0A517N787_9BACT|nr:hypothetical protein [Rubripirellula lacrimiformis]QDT03003.1 hypothetical protein K227x_13820 [Rubripirellula lacrimiformis]